MIMKGKKSSEAVVFQSLLLPSVGHQRNCIQNLLVMSLNISVVGMQL